MEKYFDDIHAMPDSQLGTAPCMIPDNAEVAACRGANDYDQLGSLAKALCFQLRYKEALEVYERMLSLHPDDPALLRARAPREINTLQPRRAIRDLLQCRALGGDEADLSYRLGIACYLAGDYAAAMQEEEICFPLVDDEMGTAAMYWHTLAALRSNAEATLLEQRYHPDIQCGHHTAYAAVMALIAGKTGREQFSNLIGQTHSDLEFSMLAYGASVFLRSNGEEERAAGLLKQVVERDGFWISYAYLAAWNDEYFGGTANGQ